MKIKHSYLIIGITILMSLIMVGTTLLIWGFNEESLRLTLRETARVSLMLFLVVFLASPLYQLRKNQSSKWLMVNRRYLGIAFAMSHSIHLILILCLVFTYAQADVLSIATLESVVFGVVGYLFLFAMLATSNNKSVQYLGYKNWKRLHTVGMYLLFVVFLVSYIGLLEKHFWFYFPFVAALVFAMVIRVLAVIKRRRISG